MTAEALQQARPNVRADGEGRLYDATLPAAFAIREGKVAGLRLIVHQAGSGQALAHYQRNFQGDAVPSADYTYKIGGHLLRIYSVAKGVEILYGIDPGPADASQSVERARRVADGGVKWPKANLPRTSRRPRPAVMPVGEDLDGVYVWLLPLTEPSTGSVSLRMIVGTGSADEGPAGQGSTALLAELAMDRVAARADAAYIQISQRTLRSATIFSVRGDSQNVAAIGKALAQHLRTQSTRRISTAEFERAHTASLRRSRGNDVDQRTLEDEALAALFPDTAFAESPVERTREAPSAEETAARAKAMGGAPVTIIATGSVDRRYAREMARALGPRPADTRTRRPKPALPNRASLRIPDPQVTVDGLWAEVDSAASQARLQVARTLLEHVASARLVKDGLLHHPHAVIAGGRPEAAYLALVTVATSSAAEALNMATRGALSSLTAAVPTGRAWDDLTWATSARLTHALATPDQSADRMVDFVLGGAKAEWIEAIVDAIEAMKPPDLKAFLSQTGQPDNTFSVRWGPNE